MRAAVERFARRWWEGELGAAGRALSVIAAPASWTWSALGSACSRSPSIRICQPWRRVALMAWSRVTPALKAMRSVTSRLSSRITFERESRIRIPSGPEVAIQRPVG